LFPFLEEQGLYSYFKRALSGETASTPDHEYVVPQSGRRGWAQTRFAPFLDPEGEIAGVIGIVHDVTERKRSENVLRESEARYRTLAEAAPDMIFIIDRNDCVEYVNRFAAESIGYSPEEIIGKPRASLFPPEVAEHQRQSLQHVVEKNEPYYAEDAVPIDGRNVRLGTWLVPMHDDEGRVRAVLGVSRDITEQKTLEEHLRQAQKMEAVGQLAGGVAHDFNNQLVGILGFSELLLRRLHDKQLRDYARNIVAAAQRSADLTRQLLAFARKGRYQTASVDMHALIREVAALIKRSIDKRIEARQHLSAQSGWVLGDPGQLHNALLNLALNARDAMPDGGVLSFETRVVEPDTGPGPLHATGTDEERQLEISVRDTGIGMSDQILERIFEPFFTTKDVGKGTGMGLASVYGTVRNHHGSIAVESELGRGSCFCIRLPLLAEPEGEQGQAEELGVRPTKAHVLVVDDEELVRVFVTELLQTAGHRVTLCRDANEALQYFRAHHEDVDLVILDMIMPGMGGLDLYRAISELDPHVRVLLASGYSLEKKAQALLDEGVLGFVQKPFSAEELEHAVASALAEHSKSGSNGG
jgi:PAS domain S-box-containing protein